MHRFSPVILAHSVEFREERVAASGKTIARDRQSRMFRAACQFLLRVTRSANFEANMGVHPEARSSKTKDFFSELLKVARAAGIDYNGKKQHRLRVFRDEARACAAAVQSETHPSSVGTSWLRALPAVRRRSTLTGGKAAGE